MSSQNYGDNVDHSDVMTGSVLAYDHLGIVGNVIVDESFVSSEVKGYSVIPI